MSQDVAAEISNEKQEPEKLFEPFGRGIIRDFKMRLPLIKSDITDGINSQVRLDKYSFVLLGKLGIGH